MFVFVLAQVSAFLFSYCKCTAVKFSLDWGILRVNYFDTDGEHWGLLDVRGRDSSVPKGLVNSVL